MHIYGAFIFGGIALGLYALWKKLPLLIYLDAVALALPLGQAIGRWANFINPELYGPPTTLPWGLRIDAAHRLPPYNDTTLYPDLVRFCLEFFRTDSWFFSVLGLHFNVVHILSVITIIAAATILFIRRRTQPQIAALQGAGDAPVIADEETRGVKDEAVEVHSSQDNGVSP